MTSENFDKAIAEMKLRIEGKQMSVELKDDGQMTAADRAEWERVKAKVREQLEKSGSDWQAERDALIAENDELKLRLSVYEWANSKEKEIVITKERMGLELSEAIEWWGSQKAFAEVCGVSESYMSDVVRGARRPGHKILRKLGLQAKIVYVPYADFNWNIPSEDMTTEEIEKAATAVK